MTAHALPEVTKAVSEQAGRILHSSTLYLNRPMVELAERIAALSGIPDARVFFTTSGTEANDTALLLATAYRRSNQILAMRNSYHGRSFTAVGITGNSAWSPTSLSPLQTLYVHGGVRTRGPYAAPVRRASSSRPASPTWRTCSGRPAARRRADRRTDPGRRRLHLAARRAVRRLPRGARPARHPVDHRRGADRLGPYRRPLLGLAGARRDRPARHPHLRQGHRQRHVHRRRRGPRRGHELPGRQLHLHLRRQPRSPWRRASPTSPTCWTTTSRATPGGSAACSSSGCGRSAPGCGVVREVRGRGLMIGVELVRPGTDEPDPAAAAARAGSGPRRRAADRQGRRRTTRSVLRIAPPLSLTVAEAEEGADSPARPR